MTFHCSVSPLTTYHHPTSDFAISKLQSFIIWWNFEIKWFRYVEIRFLNEICRYVWIFYSVDIWRFFFHHSDRATYDDWKQLRNVVNVLTVQKRRKKIIMKVNEQVTDPTLMLSKKLENQIAAEFRLSMDGSTRIWIVITWVFSSTRLTNNQLAKMGWNRTIMSHCL